MGWKTLREQYGIKHIVQRLRDGTFAVGSPYISRLLVVHPDGKVEPNSLLTDNSELWPVIAAMRADPGAVRRAIEAEDVFATSVPVYSCEGAVLIESFCETPGYPNVTHDGTLMYENSYYLSRAEALEVFSQAASRSVEHREEAVTRAREELDKALERLDAARQVDSSLKAQVAAELPKG